MFTKIVLKQLDGFEITLDIAFRKEDLEERFKYEGKIFYHQSSVNGLLTDSSRGNILTTTHIFKELPEVKPEEANRAVYEARLASNRRAQEVLDWDMKQPAIQNINAHSPQDMARFKREQVKHRDGQCIQSFADLMKVAIWIGTEEGKGGWQELESIPEIKRRLQKAVDSRDWVSVGNYAMMMSYHGANGQ